MIDWIACFSVRALGGFLCLLPAGWAVSFGRGAGRLAHDLQPKRARIAWNNLRAAYRGQEDESVTRAWVRECFASMGASLCELLRLPVIDLATVQRYIHVENKPIFDAAVTSGRPVILLTGHYGNWELTAITSALHGHPFVALARLQNRMPRLYRLLVSYREAKGLTVVHKGGAMRKLLQALDEGRLVGIVGDQASRQGILQEFFGRPALFATGPFHMAYKKRALIVPAFIHRTRGPCHHLQVEPALDLARNPDEEASVAEGVAAFAALLEKHIRAHPEQWLWMHKRWKYSPARRAVILSDGKPGHVKQSRAVADALREHNPELRTAEILIKYRSPAWRTAVLIGAVIAPGSRLARWALRRGLDDECAHVLFRDYADVAIACGSAMHPVAAIWNRPARQKGIAVLDPHPIPRRYFDKVVIPQHDAPRAGKRVIAIRGALGVSDPHRLRAAAEALARHPAYKRIAARGPVAAICLGGDTPEHRMSVEAVARLLDAWEAWAGDRDGGLVLTSSRRTPPEVEAYLEERLRRHPRCALLVLASKDATPGVMEGMLGLAAAVIVSGESISMVTEAASTGKPVVIFDLERKGPEGSAKHERFLEGLEAEGCIARWRGQDLAPLLETPPRGRIDNSAALRAGLKGLL